MVYRKKNGTIAFNDYDITDFMTNQFNMANNPDELKVIKKEFNRIMDNVIRKIKLEMQGRTMTVKEEKELKNTELRMKYWNW